MPRKKTTEEFIEQAKTIHGDKYEYFGTQYFNSKTKVIINCPTHGEFNQIPNSHLHGNGCEMCARIKRRNALLCTTEKFIEKAKKKHGDKYDYSKVVYVNDKGKVIITCPIHGDVKVICSNHLQGSGCPTCGNKRSGRASMKFFTKEEFIEKAKKTHGDKYDYSKVIGGRAQSSIIITCRTHGDFEQLAHNHLKGHGCIRCGNLISANSRRSSTTEFIKKAKKIHNDKYDYSKVVYKNTHTKVIITCPIHGDFKQTPDGHLSQRNGCKKCSCNGYSKVGIKWLEWRMIRDNCFIRHAENGGEKKIELKKVDGFCEETNTVYEFNGDYFHGNPMIHNPYAINERMNKTYWELYTDTIKRKNFIINKGFRVITIWGHEWKYKIKCVKKIQKWWKKNK